MTSTITLQSILTIAIEADRKATESVNRLQRELAAAQAVADLAAAERRRIEGLARGTGQVFTATVGFGPSNGGGQSPEDGFAHAVKAGRIPVGAESLRFTDVGGGGLDPAHWGGSATAHYVLPSE